MTPLTRRVALATALALVPFALSGTRVADAAPHDFVVLQIVSFSDWHGQLDPLGGPAPAPFFGGAEALSTYFAQERAENPNTLVVTAGDQVGGTPPLSSFFDDVPAIKALNLMGVDVTTFGNHDFDHGTEHLQEQIDLAEYSYVAANLDGLEGVLDDVAPYEIFDLGGVPVAVIGIVNEEAPELTAAGAFGDIEIKASVMSANRARAAALAEGAKVIVILTHKGITGKDAFGAAFGPLVDFANEVGTVDLIIGDHTDFEYSAVHNGSLVVENRSKGATYAVTTLVVDAENGRLVSAVADFEIPYTAAVAADPAITAMLAPYRAELSAKMDIFIGSTTGRYARGSNVERLGEVALGNLVAGAIRQEYGTQIALINGGGLRAPLPITALTPIPGLDRSEPAPYDLVIGDIYAVLPFGNETETMVVTGAQLWAALENGVSFTPGANGRFPQISGFRFVYDSAKPAGSKVVSVTLDGGTPIPPDATTYTLATVDFMYEGGDGYGILNNGTGVTRDLMAETVREYIEEAGTISPFVDGRICNKATTTCP